MGSTETKLLAAERSTGPEGRFRFYNYASRNHQPVLFSLTDERGDSTSRSFSYQGAENSDPVILDLNGDRSVEITGTPVVDQGIEVNSWTVERYGRQTAKRLSFRPRQYKRRNGTFMNSVSLNAAGRWKIAIEKENDQGEWEEIETTQSFKKTGTLKGRRRYYGNWNKHPMVDTKMMAKELHFCRW